MRLPIYPLLLFVVFIALSSLISAQLSTKDPSTFGDYYGKCVENRSGAMYVKFDSTDCNQSIRMKYKLNVSKHQSSFLMLQGKSENGDGTVQYTIGNCSGRMTFDNQEKPTLEAWNTMDPLMKSNLTFTTGIYIVLEDDHQFFGRLSNPQREIYNSSCSPSANFPSGIFVVELSVTGNPPPYELIIRDQVELLEFGAFLSTGEPETTQPITTETEPETTETDETSDPPITETTSLETTVDETSEPSTVDAETMLGTTESSTLDIKSADEPTTIESDLPPIVQNNTDNLLGMGKKPKWWKIDLWVIAGLILLIIVCLVLLIICCRCRNKRREKKESKKGSDKSAKEVSRKDARKVEAANKIQEQVLESLKQKPEQSPKDKEISKSGERSLKNVAASQKFVPNSPIEPIPPEHDHMPIVEKKQHSSVADTPLVTPIIRSLKPVVLPSSAARKRTTKPDTQIDIFDAEFEAKDEPPRSDPKQLHMTGMNTFNL